MTTELNDQQDGEPVEVDEHDDPPVDDDVDEWPEPEGMAFYLDYEDEPQPPYDDAEPF